ncbi:MAG: hypothetical protein JRI71_16810 [Deltaproteobacteria bacterium]|nr:hypothetical protein [Deltaproteobacteria bacterium]
MATTNVKTHGTDVVYLEDYGADPALIGGRVAIYQKGGDFMVKDNDDIVSVVKDVYGGMYLHHGSLTITVSVQSTDYEIDSGVTTGSALQGCTFGGDHYVAVDHPGTYLISWSLAVDTAMANDEIEGGFMIDGAAQDAGSSHTCVVAASKSSAMAGTAIVALTANQQISLFVANESAARDIVVEHVTLTVVRVGE